MEDKKKQLLSVLKARMEEARNKAIAEGRTIQPMQLNPMIQKLMERAKANGVQPKPMQMKKMSREELVSRLKSRMVKKVE